MTVPEVKEIRTDIDILAQICGHFTDCETNNGYGCDAPKSEDDCDEEGECHRRSCPVAWYDSDTDEMVIFDAETIKKLEASKK